MAHNQHAVKCLDCEQVYSARLHDDELLLPTETGVCQCGATELHDMTTGEVHEIASALADGDDSEGEPAG